MDGKKEREDVSFYKYTLRTLETDGAERKERE